MDKIFKVFLSLSILIFSASTYVQAKSGDTTIGLTYGSGSGEVKLSGTKYDVDVDQTTLGFRTYMDGNIYVGGSLMSGELTLAGIKIDTEATTFSGGYYDGDIDYIAGTGELFRFGISASDVEVSLGSVSSSETTYNIGFGNQFGLGSGNAFHFSFSTDTDDLFSDNSYTGAFTKAYGSVIFEVGINYNIYVTDALNSGDSTYIFFGVGTVF